MAAAFTPARRAAAASMHLSCCSRAAATVAASSVRPHEWSSHVTRSKSTVRTTRSICAEVPPPPTAVWSSRWAWERRRARRRRTGGSGPRATRSPTKDSLRSFWSLSSSRSLLPLAPPTRLSRLLLRWWAMNASDAAFHPPSGDARSGGGAGAGAPTLGAEGGPRVSTSSGASPPTERGVSKSAAPATESTTLSAWLSSRSGGAKPAPSPAAPGAP
mmetsp:Transcript_19790/g.66999  ORF Transcript_19790/g.66999 Transcript_19790/m.66999 type:complete len:216 (+) Transcript_19790:115-762(+)